MTDALLFLAIVIGPLWVIEILHRIFVTNKKDDDQ